MWNCPVTCPTQQGRREWKLSSDVERTKLTPSGLAVPWVGIRAMGQDCFFWCCRHFMIVLSIKRIATLALFTQITILHRTVSYISCNLWGQAKPSVFCLYLMTDNRLKRPQEKMKLVSVRLGKIFFSV